MWGIDRPASAVLGSLLSPFPRGGDAEGLTEPPKIDAPLPMGLIISRAASPGRSARHTCSSAHTREGVCSKPGLQAKSA